MVTLWGYLKYRCMISPKAEVEVTAKLSIGRGSIVSSFTKIKSADGPLQIGRNVEIHRSPLKPRAYRLALGDHSTVGVL